MKKTGIVIILVTIIVLTGIISGNVYSGPQNDRAVPQRGAVELAQLNIFDDPAFDRRIADAQRKIDNGKRSGRLSPREAEQLQAILDRIKERIAKYRRDGFLTSEERSKLNENLTLLEDKIREEKTDDERSYRDAFDKRVSEMQRRIDVGVRAGQLTRDEASDLQIVLNRIKDRDARYKADGSLTNEERKKIQQMLNSLDERIRYERNDSDVVHREAFDRRISELKRKIEAGMRAGQLTLDEACRLNSMLLRIKERDERFRSDGVLTREERVRLNQMLIHLEERIYEERWDADVNNPLFR